MITTVMYCIVGINIALMIVLILKNISALPAKIPLLFNSKGEVDRIYSKYFLWIFPAINTGVMTFSFFMKTDTIQSLTIDVLASIFFAYMTFCIIEISKNKINKLPKTMMIYSICFALIIIGDVFFDGK